MAAEEGASLTRRIVSVSTRWMSTVLIYGFAGLAVSWACYVFLFPALWNAVPALPVARAGGLGAVLALLVLLTLPLTYITLLYVVAFPLGFFFLGHVIGLKAAVWKLVSSYGKSLAPRVTDLVWPTAVALSKTPGNKTVHDFSSKLLAHGEQRGVTRRIVRLLLRQAKVPQLVTQTEYLDQVRRDPQQSRLRLQGATERLIDGSTSTNRSVPLLVAVCGVVLLTSASRFWLPWLGIAVD